MRDFDFDRHLGNKIRFYRKSKGFSQSALGDKLGLSFQQIHKYEVGENSVSASILSKIALILSCSVSELLGEKGITQKNPKYMRDAAELLSNFDKIESAASRKAIIKLVKAFRKTD